MDLTLVQSGEWKGWWCVTHPTKLTLRFIKYSIPQTHRNLVDNVWYIHEKYVDGVRQIHTSEKLSAIKLSAPIADPYAVLHLLPTAPPAIIKAAWRELAKLLHPDHGGNSEQFRRAKEAYEMILSKEK